jgi:hypothetical protein
MTRARQKVPAGRAECAALQLADLARRQHGVVARRRLMASGLSASAGVYAVGHPKSSRDGRWLAAALAGGPGAALGYATAAFERAEQSVVRALTAALRQRAA